jgi:hypothetical protein
LALHLGSDQRRDGGFREDFGLAAAAMVEAWTFEPAMKEGKPSWALLTTKQIFKRTGSEAPVDGATVELADAIKRKKVKIHELAKVAMRPKAIYRVLLPRIVKTSDKAFGWAALLC